MSQKAYLIILKIGAFLAMTPIFFVFKNLLFPFITSKQIPFNILIEVLMIFWAGLIIKYPDFNPFKNRAQKNLISFGLVAFFAIMVLSCITGVDFNLSFWGDIERMLGAFHILHFFGLYLILITVFRKWSDWKEMLSWSLFLSVILAIKGISGVEYSTLGNASYVSGYLMFNMYFAVLLFYKEKNTGLRWLYLIPLIFQFGAFNRANTTGAIVGLVFSILVSLFLYGILQKNRMLRYTFLVVFLAAAAFSVFALTNKQSALVQNVPILKRTVGEISFDKPTFQTRLISWKAAFKDFKTHPLLGTGHGNYAIVFDKYFDPKFYNYTDQETYFDRAHNNVIDIASTTGALGLAAYLSVFVFVLYYLIQKYRARGIALAEFVLLFGLFTAYFVQNLAVFDSMATYLMLMLVLGYVHWLNAEEEGYPAHLGNGRYRFVETIGKDAVMGNREAGALVFAGALMIFAAFQYNIQPWRMLIGTIDGQRLWSQGDKLGTLEAYQKALALDTVLDRDSRTSFVRLIISDPGALSSLGNPAQAEKMLLFSIDLSEKNVAYNAGDSLNQMMLAQNYNVAAMFYQKDAARQKEYNDKALAAIDKSISASPGRMPTYYQKAQIQITKGDTDGAIATMRAAVDLNQSYPDSHCYLAKTMAFFQREAEAEASVEKCIDLNGANRLAPASMIKNYINIYVEKEDWERVLKLYIGLSQASPNDSEVWIKLATLYKQLGKKDEAIASARKAIEVDPKVKTSAESFIKELEGE